MRLPVQQEIYTRLFQIHVHVYKIISCVAESIEANDVPGFISKELTSL